MSAALWAGDEAVVCGPTAAELRDGAYRDPLIHVGVDPTQKLSPPPWIRVRRHNYPDSDVVRTLFPARTRAERTVLDMVDDSTSLTAAVALVAEACQRRWTTAARLKQRFAASPECRWRRPVLTATSEVAAGATTIIELLWRRIEQKHNLPTGRMQAPARRIKRCYRDCMYDDFEANVELDGRLGHEDPLNEWRDMDSDNASTVYGVNVLRYGWVAVFETGCHAAAQVAALLIRHGWSERPGPCSPGCPILGLLDEYLAVGNAGLATAGGR